MRVADLRTVCALLPVWRYSSLNVSQILWERIVNIQRKTSDSTLARSIHCLLALLLGASMATMSVSASAQTTTGEPSRHTMHPNAGHNGMPMDMHGSMKDMGNKMGASGDIDYDFATMMREHHQGAIVMAEQELKRGKDPQMKQMARDIIAAQKEEIAKFDEWIAAHKKQ